MNFNTLEFTAVLPAIVLVYYLFPPKMAWIWLLVASLLFYASWNPAFLPVLLLVTLITWLAGKGAGRGSVKARKLWVSAAVILILGLLFIYKYFNFAAQSLAWLSGCFGRPYEPLALDLITPVGISFFTLQGLSYVIDRYRGQVEEEGNPLRYLLFICFFPQISSGPIGKAKDLLPKLRRQHPLRYEAIKLGILQMLWGSFQKLVIAEPINNLVRTAYGDPEGYSGFPLWLAVFSYGIQIYCDFAGYSNIAVGAARLMGIELQQNFERPYFAVTMKEFWRRWHISLSTWFRDYLYFPLGGSRCARLKKYRNLLIVFLASGLWHGSNGTFLVWGGIHGLYQIFGDLWAPVRKRVYTKLRLKEEHPFIRAARSLWVYILAGFAWVFFRAPDLSYAGRIFTRLFYPTVTRPYGLTLWQGVVLGVFLAAFLLIEIWIERKGDLFPLFQKKNAWIQGSVYLGLLFVILIFGYYGPGYSSGDFIYSHF